MISVFTVVNQSLAQKVSEMPASVRPFVQSIKWQNFGGQKPVVRYETISPKVTRVSLSWKFADTVRQDDWRVDIIPAFDPSFHWAPHLSPTDEHVIAQHLFRAPALIMASRNKQITIVPDLDVLQKNKQGEWYMDMNALGKFMRLGLSRTKVKEHVSFIRTPGAEYAPGNFDFASL